MKTIAIIGFGKIGQAIAANALQHDFRVIAVDTDPAIGERFRQDVFVTNEPDVQPLLAEAFRSGHLQVRQALNGDRPDAVIISIPLRVDDNKKMIDEPFVKCFRELVPFCSDQLLIVVETSVPVGYCRNTLLPVLESGGKKHGVDFFLAHSPERIKSGTMMKQLGTVPKVIGGITTAAADACISLYRLLLKEQLLNRVESIEAAEMLKLAGMIYRDLNIALSNQLAMFAQQAGIDFVSLIPLINTDNEAGLLQPGIGVGGHCTPVYPYFLVDNFSRAGLDFSLARTGRQINDSMASFAVSLIQDKTEKKTALILGLSFRPNVKEDANSVGASLYALLQQQGYDVRIHDTEFGEQEIEAKGMRFEELYDTTAEVVFLVTMHREYSAIDFSRLAANGVRYIVDGRNTLSREKIDAAGIAYFGIGRGGGVR
jgi:nucleotide sugar dehydrogenase